MGWSIPIFRIAGIQLRIHVTFVLLIAWLAFGYYAQGGTPAAAEGVIFVLLLFLCVVLHEFGHALAAKSFGINTPDITLLPIGGVARLERMPEEPKQELVIAVAGPAVNVVIALGLFVAGGSFNNPFVNPGAPERVGLVSQLLIINVLLVAFNLLPAFPMDGGRVLRALLATRMEYTQATQVAAQVGQGMAFLFGLAGLFYDPFLLFIALFVWMGASEEAAMVQMRSSLGGIPVQRVMLTDFRKLTADDTLATAVNHILAGWQQDFPVVFGDSVLGILTREDLIRTVAQQGSNAPVREA